MPSSVAKDLVMHRLSFTFVTFALAVLIFSPCIARTSDDVGKTQSRPENRLAKETSPYLLLHAHNPVDWYPWGPEALAKAKAERKPIFLSVGYSSCYWCHVMERESFMDPEIARVLNASFVCIKVDREERPDVDQVYMAALQALGPGGWPMSLFLTPDGRPFVGGTYFPPRDREGASGFLTIVTEVAKAWTNQRAELEKAAGALTDAARRRLKATSGPGRLPLARAASAEGRSELALQFDPEHGGFGFNPKNPRRPKFPEPVNLIFLLDQHRRSAGSIEPKRALEMVLVTLDHMARGGIRDQLGGGYHRYSTDRYWIVPHFEKMLYDNAQLATVHLAAHEVTKDPRWRWEAEATFAFIEQKMTAPEGGFYSALDAETTGQEGATYVWTRDEVKAAVGESSDADAFAQVYGLTGEPKVEDGRYVLYEPRARAEQAAALKTTPEELEARLRPLRAKLLTAREKRPAPMLDDKVITGWNGLMIAAYADGYRILKVEKYRVAAEKAAAFLLENLRAPDGRLLRTYRLGKAKLPAYLEDYACLVHGLLRLHRATGEARWVHEAGRLSDRMLADFEDREQGGFFFTANDHESLLARIKDPFDSALPGGNSIAILDLIELHRLTGNSSYLDHAGQALGAFSTSISQLPAAMPLLLVGLEQYLDARPEATSAKALAKPATGDRSSPVVTARARLSDGAPVAIAEGREFEAMIEVNIQPPWHIYANPTGLAELKPTTLDLNAQPTRIATLVEVVYPAGEAKVLASLGTERVALYEKDIQIRARLRVGRDARPGPATLKFVLNYQACNERLCDEPTKLEIPLNLSVGH
jgi:uncharacterized protein YyaL (SSP411 family)